MFRKLRPRSIYDVMAAIGCFAALATGTAYAANEWNSSNIQNETLLSEDVKNGTLKAEDYGVGSVSGARIQDNNVTTLDLADGAIFGNDVRDESLTSADIHNFSLGNGDFLDGSVDSRVATDNSLTGADIDDSSLNDEDIGEETFVNFEADIGSVPAQACVLREITGVNARGDHLLLTPSINTANTSIVYSVGYTTQAGVQSAYIQACNTFGSAINQGIVRFNLLVIDAQ